MPLKYNSGGIAHAGARIGVVRSTVGIVLRALLVMIATFYVVGFFLDKLGAGEGILRELYEIGLTCILGLPLLYQTILRPMTRLAAKQAASGAETLFRTVAQAVQDGIVIYDTRSRVRFVNKAAEHMHGYAAGKLQGKLLEILIPEDGRQLFREHIDQFIRTKESPLVGKGSLEMEGLMANGDRFPVELSISHLEATGESLLVVVVRDISARKQAELAIIEAEQTLRKILDTIPLGVRIVQNGQVVFANPADAQLHGFSDASEETGIDSSLNIAPKEFERLQGYAERRASGIDAPRRYEAQRRRRDGTEFPAEMHAELIHFKGEPASLLVIQDVADQRRLRMYEQLLPICCVCGKIRDDEGAGPGGGIWDRLDHYISKHTDAKLSHTFCPTCLEQYRKEQGI